jgi:purine-binding chemotaxis protein CheW
MTGSVLFRCGGRALALPMDAVVEVFRMVAVSARLPRAPRHALGVIDCRGRLVPLIDLGARLGLEKPRNEAALVDGHVLVVHDPMGAVGYAVDEVSELVETEPEPLAGTSTALGAVVRAAVRIGAGELVPLLDPPALLTARARHALASAIGKLSAARTAPSEGGP